MLGISLVDTAERAKRTGNCELLRRRCGALLAVEALYWRCERQTLDGAGGPEENLRRTAGGGVDLRKLTAGEV